LVVECCQSNVNHPLTDQSVNTTGLLIALITQSIITDTHNYSPINSNLLLNQWKPFCDLWSTIGDNKKVITSTN